MPYHLSYVPGQLAVGKKKLSCIRQGQKSARVVHFWQPQMMLLQALWQMEHYLPGVHPSQGPRRGRGMAWRPLPSNDFFSWGLLRPGSPLAADRWKGRTSCTFKRSTRHLSFASATEVGKDLSFESPFITEVCAKASNTRQGCGSGGGPQLDGKAEERIRCREFSPWWFAAASLIQDRRIIGKSFWLGNLGPRSFTGGSSEGAAPWPIWLRVGSADCLGDLLPRAHFFTEEFTGGTTCPRSFGREGPSFFAVSRANAARGVWHWAPFQALLGPQVEEKPEDASLVYQEASQCRLSCIYTEPKAHVGVFFVKKTDDKIRLIIDARGPNKLFKDPPGVDLLSSDGFARTEVLIPAGMERGGEAYNSYLEAFSLSVGLTAALVEWVFLSSAYEGLLAKFRRYIISGR